MRRIRVLIVEDSAVVREHLRRIIDADPRLQVAGAAASGEEALAMLDSAAPDVISMDIRLPGMQGFEATRRIMSQRPTPIVVVSAVESEEMNLTMEALKAGALGVVEKPVGIANRDYEALAARLCTQLIIMSEVKVVRQRLPGMRPVSLPAPPPAARRVAFQVLGVAASTGGPSALAGLLNGLGPGFPLPVLLVQHMTPGFVEGFRAWLASVIALPVDIIDGKVSLAGGRVYLCSSGRHLVTDGRFAWTEGLPQVCSHAPSGNVLFSSMARHADAPGLGVLLTGMGEDGAQGLLELREAGGYTIAEDESTAVVYGMPAAAAHLGAVCESLPLPEIAPRILELVAAAREGPGL